MEEPRGYISEIFGSFQGEGPYLGERHVFVRLAGCDLGCAYCDTPGSARRPARALVEIGPGRPCREAENPMSAVDAAEAVLAQELYPGFNAALAVTGGEPLDQPEFVEALLNALGGRLRVIIETGGTRAGAMERLRGLVDVVSMDVKLPAVSGLGPLWDEHAAFMDACAGRELIIKAVVSEDTPPDELSRAAELAGTHAPDALFVIQPVAGPDGRPGVTGGTLLDFYMLARAHARRVRVIPQVHRLMGVK